MSIEGFLSYYKKNKLISTNNTTNSTTSNHNTQYITLSREFYIKSDKLSPKYSFRAISRDDSYFENFKKEMGKFFPKKVLSNKNLNMTTQTLQKEILDTNMKYWFDIYEHFNIETISNITANKCIVDHLGNPISNISNIQLDVKEINDWVLNELNKKPTDLFQLSSRRFEELIAEIFIRKGYSVELTPATHDGGKDIYVAHKNDFGSFLYLVECKKYNPTRKVGINIIRDLYGVLSKEKATYGIVVTTSDFTKPAQEFQQDLKFQMSLKNFDSIKKWLCDVT